MQDIAEVTLNIFSARRLDHLYGSGAMYPNRSTQIPEVESLEMTSRSLLLAAPSCAKNRQRDGRIYCAVFTYFQVTRHISVSQIRNGCGTVIASQVGAGEI